MILCHEENLPLAKSSDPGQLVQTAETDLVDIFCRCIK